MIKNDKVLVNIISRIEKLERVVFVDAKVKSKSTNKKYFQGATGGLRFLVSRGFFDRKHTFAEIKKALADNNYHYIVVKLFKRRSIICRGRVDYL